MRELSDSQRRMLRDLLNGLGAFTDEQAKNIITHRLAREGFTKAEAEHWASVTIVNWQRQLTLPDVAVQRASG